VSWANVTAAPAWLNATYTGSGGIQVSGNALALAPVMKKVYFPANSLSHSTDATITQTGYGLDMTATSTTPVQLVMPRPLDAVFVSTSPLTVTVYFAIPSGPSGSYCWQLRAGTAQTDLQGATGWDSLDYWETQNCTNATAFGSAGAYTNVVKTQTWTASWSATYSTFYFGSGVTSNDDFVSGPMWRFGFLRGYPISGNPEAYAGDFVVLGVAVSYLASR